MEDERLAMAEAAGYLFVKGSATEEETLLRAGAERAQVLATVLPQDTVNVFITLTARNLNRNLRIIARGEQPSTEKKLLQAGANEVVLPAAIGGSRIAHIITRPTTMNFLGDARGMVGEELKRLGVEITELRLHQHTFLVGKKVLELQNLAEGNLLVLAVQRADGNVLKSGFLEESLREGDAVIILGRTHVLPPLLRAEVEREELL
jgi:voltage-gated potassium channel